MRIILPIIVSILSIFGGLTFLNYSILLLITIGNEGLVTLSGREKIQAFIYLVLIIVPFILILKYLKKKKMHVIMNTAIYSFSLSILLSPILLPYTGDFINFVERLLMRITSY